MKTITVALDPTVYSQSEVIYATNDDGTGLFSRAPHENGWRQLSGTGQFYAKSYRSFLAQLRKRGITGDVLGSRGWD